MLIAMAGLPGVGKSSLARALGRELRAPVLAVDAVEAAITRAGAFPTRTFEVGLAAYAVVHEAATAVLDAGHSAIIDAANLVEPARAGWRALASERGVPLRWIEVVCSDPRRHRQRLEDRGTRYAGLTEPTWAEVQARETEPWADERLVLDSVRPLDQLVPEALAHLTRAAR